ncbi:hypothetical protein D0V11_25015 [Salmonella enterica]|nr:hypothetical protein [Salmonella enterica]
MITGRKNGLQIHAGIIIFMMFIRTVSAGHSQGTGRQDSGVITPGLWLPLSALFAIFIRQGPHIYLFAFCSHDETFPETAGLRPLQALWQRSFKPPVLQDQRKIIFPNEFI